MNSNAVANAHWTLENARICLDIALKQRFSTKRSTTQTTVFINILVQGILSVEWDVCMHT